MTRSEYDAIDAVNWSTLKHILRSPAHYKAALEKKLEDTTAFKFGRCAHAFILEGKQEWVVAPDIDKRKKEYKEWLESVDPKSEIISRKEEETISAMSTEILACKNAQKIMEGCQFEHALQGNLHGVDCKALTDMIYVGDEGEDSYISDYKTTQDCRPFEFAKGAAKFLYHGQVAFYAKLAEVVYGRKFGAYIVAQEKEPPYAVACYWLGEEDMRKGEAIYMMALDILKKCRETGKWPAYEDVINVLELPKWA